MFGNYITGTRNLKGRPGDEKRIKGAAPPSRFTKASTSGPQATPDVRCQKCLKLGHYTYDCKNTTAYKARPSRSQQLLKGKQGSDKPSVETPAEFGGSGVPVTRNDTLAVTSGLASKILADKEKERKKKRRHSHSSSSSSSSDSDSDSDSDSSSSDSSDSSSSSDSDSASSSSSSSASSRRASRRKRRSSTRERSRSPVRRRRQGSASEDDASPPKRRARSYSVDSRGSR